MTKAISFAAAKITYLRLHLRQDVNVRHEVSFLKLPDGFIDIMSDALKRYALLILLGAAAQAHAQYRHNTDYYFDRSDKLLREQLANVELHLEACVHGPESRRYPQALADCVFMLNYFPNHPRALMGMADTCLAWNSPRCEADVYFQRAIEINPKAPTTYVVLGIYLLRAHHVSEAISSLETAVSLDPKSVNARYNLGLAYIDNKQYELANQHAQRAYELGAALPGLRDKLKRAGYWKPLDVADATREEATPAPRNAEAPKN